MMGALALVLAGCHHGSPTAPKYGATSNLSSSQKTAQPTDSVKSPGGQTPSGVVQFCSDDEVQAAPAGPRP